MLDRATNLVVLLSTLLAAIVFSMNLSSFWNNRQPWDQAWLVRTGHSPKYDAEKLLAAMRNANEARDYSAVSSLRNALEADYTPRRIHTHITGSEILESLAYAGIASLVLIIPVALNYVRHGKFSLWNRGS